VKNESNEGLQALRTAAVMQAVLGAGLIAFGHLLVQEVSLGLSFPEDVPFLCYPLLGVGFVGLSHPLSRGMRWAWNASVAAAVALPLLPCITILQYGFGHGIEVSLLVLFFSVPSVVLLGILYRVGRSALREGNP
jgi:hypothetical protein